MRFRTFHSELCDIASSVLLTGTIPRPYSCCIIDAEGDVVSFANAPPSDAPALSSSDPPSDAPASSSSDHSWALEQCLLGNDAAYKFKNSKKVVVPCDKICFLYGGQGTQWLNMGKRLIKESVVFRETVLRLEGFLAELDSEFPKLTEMYSCAIFRGEDLQNLD